MKVAFILGEESADRIGADLLRHLKRMAPETISAIGLGGPSMRAEGLESLFDIEELSIIGIGAIVARLPKLLGRLNQTIGFLRAQRPDVIVTIDSFTFSNRVAAKLRPSLPETVFVNVVPPAIWAYRPERARKLSSAVDRTLCLFPFEPEALQRHGGPPASYIGHPIMADPHLRTILERDAAIGSRQPATRPTLLILPGSRRGEITRLMDDFGRTFADLSERVPNLRGVLPAVSRVRPLIEEKLRSWSIRPELVEGEDAKWQAFSEADAAIAASGTVALELALAAVPMVLAYRLDPISYRLRHLMTGWTAALPNFVAGHPLVPEHFHETIQPEHLARRLERLMTRTPERAAQIAGFEAIRAAMTVPEVPGVAAARIILDMQAERKTGAEAPV
ncbi:lipid-A-disaccharide synthase [Aureimonas phyllosphaerae]|uniref:Lipid-A-disaccharide synthase n=1 Tax=Aureimonas phyllosphaerae TaxID=1166078 RepID=A0A7W6BMX3_9HYPH|nr:lipid-A-disaccharide synthase [Aureimonas phyllosphaerae]MBB3934836.1 lipid-A-disaccharide synthase [Aureimonas phyllosphaerae]MBB3957949.1 lipid-A-disaccharide synthase [Aureimonas phyllosphaerae]SFF43907.1 lipid-A-disaccharide synthase [Aureimonas phyllosphaerae]